GARRRGAELPGPRRVRPPDRRPGNLLRARPPGDRGGEVRGHPDPLPADGPGELAIGAAAGGGQRLRVRRDPRSGSRGDRRTRRGGRDLMELAFTGLRVVEIADDPAGEHTGKLLADQGATVVKIEPEGGATSRHIGPWAGGVQDVDRSLHFWTYNTSKKSVVLPDDDEGRAARDRLIADADVLLTTGRPVDLERAG